ncbi:MAG: hypothetical protein DME72_05065 [Verrucomicrobia bacterium]|nr:MAG: hypothetical protein DME72_05065 [Verrucomicrobiota bacterium]
MQLFLFPLFALPNEPSRRLQVWLESRLTCGGDLRELKVRERKLPELTKDGFPKHRFVGESRWLLVKL